MSRALHPEHGVDRPRQRPPRRAPNSIRRTTTHDATRPEGPTALVVERASGADTFTDAGGTPHRLAATQLSARIDGAHGYRLTDLDVQPAVEGHGALQHGLLGHGVISGFRGRLSAVVPADTARGSLLYQLLDDLPGAVLVSGVALLAVRRTGLLRSQSGGARHPRQSVGLCAGFQPGTPLSVAIADQVPPPTPTGPSAPPLTDNDDPWAWHELRSLEIHEVRRARMLDVRPDPGGGPIEVEAYFRDSYRSPDPQTGEMVVHEYTVRTTLDPLSLEIVDSSAEAHTLPWAPCSDAIASGARLAGQRIGTLRELVRDSFTGVSTCTHLNDAMRSLDDVGPLLDAWHQRQDGGATPR